MSFLTCVASFVGLACAFDLLRGVRDLFSFSMSLTLSSVFVDFSLWRSLDADFVRERAGMTMTVQRTGAVQTPNFPLWRACLPRDSEPAQGWHQGASPGQHISCGRSSTSPTVSSVPHRIHSTTHFPRATVIVHVSSAVPYALDGNPFELAG